MSNILVIAILIIFAISLFLSLLSVNSLKKDSKVTSRVKKELSKGRVVYSDKTADK